jgi:mono/diheme cytochrome c family protein
MKARTLVFLAAILAAIALVAMVWAQDEAKAPAPPKGDVKAGKAIYEKNCIICHGKDGTGNKPVGVLPYSDPQVIKTHPTADKWVKAITDGVKGPKVSMKGYNGQLKPAEINNVAAYTWQFRTPKPKKEEQPH